MHEGNDLVRGKKDLAQLDMKNCSNSSTNPLVWVLLSVFLIGFISMPREEYIADPMAVRCETVSLINKGNLAVPEEISSGFGDKGQYFFENPVTHKRYSKYGIGNSLMNVPPLLVEKLYNGKLPYFSGSRVIFLNIFNLILSVASAWYLFLIASRYTKSTSVVIFYVLTALYCTYWWNYLRAQNSEIYQALFMLGFYYHITSLFRHFDPKGIEVRTEWRQLFLAGLFLGMLILVKTVYVILIPITFLWIMLFELYRPRLNFKTSSAHIYKTLSYIMFWVFIPVACALFILLAVNAYKFGSPFETGYGQWQERGKPIFSGNLLAGMYGMLFDVQGSIFMAFPILGFAIFSFPIFFKKYPADTLLFLVMGTVLFLLHAKFLNYLGTWGYGPRYMLAILPLLSLPFIQTLEFLLSHLRRWWAVSCLMMMILSLIYSCSLQLNVNALPFFAFFKLQGLFSSAHDSAIDRYFTSHSFGAINGDLLDYKAGKSWQVLEMIAPRLTPQQLEDVKNIVNQEISSNYYWWP